ncbi:OmpA family protein [Desulfovibrio aminophilus]|uniref:OmpA family protein n=1 Tax=Desulfovibrio aminophilus TaxID=81425 RepID=UPI0004003051|nr:OmpA family protein [Desulfovibrio aminophilus]
MKHMQRSLVAMAALLLLASTAFAAPKMTPKVDNFILFQDYSGSMAMDYKGGAKTKIALAKETLLAMNAKIPALPYKGSLYTFAPYGKFQELKPYDKAGLDAAIGKIKTDYEIYGRQTPMGDGLMSLDPVIGTSSGRIAVVLLTDGENNLGTDPVAEAKALYAKYGNRLCIHVVSYADTAHGKRIVDELRAISKCAVFVEGAALKDGAVMDQFVKDVFYDMGAAPAASDKEVIVFRSLNFGFDKFAITDEMIPSLEQALLLLKQRPEMEIVVEGHTDSIGTEVYNQGLSERRAKSVSDWLVKNGIDSQRIESAGYGKMKPKYDNSTAEGRALNRRVEIRSK